MIDPVMPTYARAPLDFVRGEGCWLLTDDDRRFLDLGAGIGVVSLGHANPRLVAALETQARQLWHVSNLYRIGPQEALARRLVAETFADTVFFTNSGTEAAELAIKMVRRFWHEAGAPERHRIVTFEGAFHGRSMAAISAAGSEKLTRGFAPLLPGFSRVPFADLDALAAELARGDVAAVMLEPVQGEGGIRPFAPEDLSRIRTLCDESGALLVLDEVQCGTGRTGRLYDHEWAGITPDIMMVAKGIGGGFPLGAVLATEAAARPMAPGSHGSTYGGNPLACAVGLEVIDTIADPVFLEAVRTKAARLQDGLDVLAQDANDIFAGWRGRGLMLGLECRVSNADVVAAGYEENLLLVPAADNVVRLLPPLTISEDEIDEGLARLARVARRLEGKA